MTRRPLVLAAAGGLAASALLAATPASAATTREACTIHARTGAVRVVADWHSSGLTKTGFVWIAPVGGTPFRIITDRVAWQRGAAGMAAGVRSWAVRYPVSFYSHARVVVQGSDGTRAGCSTH